MRNYSLQGIGVGIGKKRERKESKGTTERCGKRRENASRKYNGVVSENYYNPLFH